MARINADVGHYISYQIETNSNGLKRSELASNTMGDGGYPKEHANCWIGAQDLHN